MRQASNLKDVKSRCCSPVFASTQVHGLFADRAMQLAKFNGKNWEFVRFAYQQLEVMLPDGRDYAARRFRTVRFRATPSSERFATVRAGTAETPI